MEFRNARLVGGALALFGLLSSLLVSPVFADTKSNYASVYEQEYYEEYNDGAPVLAAEPFYFDVNLGVTYSNYSGSGLINATEMDDGGQAMDCGALYDGGSVSSDVITWTSGTYTYDYTPTYPQSVIAANCSTNPSQDPFSYNEWTGSADFQGSWTVTGGATWNDSNGGAYPGVATADVSLTAP